MLQQRPKDQAQPPTAAAPPNDDVGVVVAFLCLGSLGDVLPLLAVARRLAASSSHQYRPHLITHALYHDRLAPFLQQTTPEAIGFTGLPFPPMPPPDAGADHIDMELEACLAVCSSALERPDSNTALLLCANLVGKFAYHMAEILGVPFLLLAPSIPPPGPVPSLFTIRSLVGVEGEEGEALMRRLRRQTDGEKGEEESDEGSEVLRYRRRRVGMAELQHWMAALLLPPYRAFCRRHGRPDAFLPSSPHAPLPDAVPLLYGVPPSLCPKPGYYPRSTHFCGSWSIDDIESDRVHELPHDLQDFVDDTSSLICVDMGSMAEVGIGGTVDWLIFAAALVQAVASIRLDRPQGTSGFVCRLLLLHFPHEVTVAALRTYLDDAAAAATTPGESPTTRGVKRPRPVETAEEGETPSSFSWVRILPPEAFLPHAALFPRCRAVVHHGGLGTTVACLRHGQVPQLVLPFTAEQALWGDTLTYKGVGLSAGLGLLQEAEAEEGPSGALADKLSTLLVQLLDGEEGMRAAACAVSRAMAEEDGVGRAVVFLGEYVRAKVATKKQV